LIDEQMMMMIN